MNLGIRPLLCALRRSPAGPVLIATQIAITLAVFANAAGIVGRYVQRINRPAGFDTRDTFEIAVASQSKRFNLASAETTDLAYLRGLSGVAAATVTVGEPLTRDGADIQLWTKPHREGRTVKAGMLPMDDQGLNALEVPLSAGRNFRASDIAPLSAGDLSSPISLIILTEHAAHTLYPQGSAVGRSAYGFGSSPFLIVGVTRNFMGPQVGQSPYDTVLVPQTAGASGQYDLLVRARPGQRDTVMRMAKQHIGLAHPDAVILWTARLSHDLRRMHANDRNVALFLVTITAVMLVICSFGVFGLATFNVGRRTRQIGVRRAIGARRRDILTHFMAESALVACAGVALGSVLALAAGQWLSDHEGMPRLNPWYLLGAVVVLGLIAQLAAWQPAWRAAHIPPAAATRTV